MADKAHQGAPDDSRYPGIKGLPIPEDLYDTMADGLAASSFLLRDARLALGSARQSDDRTRQLISELGVEEAVSMARAFIGVWESMGAIGGTARAAGWRIILMLEELQEAGLLPVDIPDEAAERVKTMISECFDTLRIPDPEDADQSDR